MSFVSYIACGALRWRRQEMMEDATKSRDFDLRSIRGEKLERSTIGSGLLKMCFIQIDHFSSIFFDWSNKISSEKSSAFRWRVKFRLLRRFGIVVKLCWDQVDWWNFMTRLAWNPTEFLRKTNAAVAIVFHDDYSTRLAFAVLSFFT